MKIIVEFNPETLEVTGKDGLLVGTLGLTPNLYDVFDESAGKPDNGELILSLSAGGMSAEDICKLKNNNVI